MSITADKGIKRKSKEPGKNARKVVTALRKFLMETDLEHLFEFTQSIGVRYSVMANVTNPKTKSVKHCCRIIVAEHDYVGTSEASIRAAIADAFAKFFCLDEHDFHDYPELQPDSIHREDDSGMTDEDRRKLGLPYNADNIGTHHFAGRLPKLIDPETAQKLKSQLRGWDET